MTHYLVTGGCGFIGSHLSNALLQAGHSVRVVDNLSSGRKENLSSKAELLIGDIRNRILMEQALAGIDGCFHLAAVASVKISQEKWLEAHEINLSATVGLLELLRGRKDRSPMPIILASSAAVYGNNEEMPLSENSATFPLTAYGVDKLASEMHARAGFMLYGMPCMALRLFNVYGPKQSADSPYSGVISIFLRQHKENFPITVFGDGNQARDFVYVEDAVTCFIAAMKQAISPCFHILNVCTGVSTTLNALADAMAQATGNSVPRHYQPARAGDIRISLGNPAEIKRVLGIAPGTSVAEGIASMLHA